jgi:hypothetical protein
VATATTTVLKEDDPFLGHFAGERSARREVERGRLLDRINIQQLGSVVKESTRKLLSQHVPCGTIDIRLVHQAIGQRLWEGNKCAVVIKFLQADPQATGTGEGETHAPRLGGGQHHAART